MKLAVHAGFVSILLLGTACNSKFNFEDMPPNYGQESISIPPSESYVCDPFDSGRKAGDHNGVVGHLHYLDSTMPHYTSVHDYIQFGNPVDDVILFINRLFVPTRPFDRGFVTLGGDVLRTKSGDRLFEWFAVDMRTKLGLGSGDVAGDYQLASISDDGSVLTLGAGSGASELINNDETHSTTMKCATQPVYFDATSRLPAKIEYFQGPRTHIALMLMWRPWPAGGPADPECDQSGNDYFFDSTQNPSAPTAVYNGLLARGWKPMSAENFYLESGVVNPCD
ncbi:MAG: hypothetical protein ABL958_05835 [Bdellovibrionia bacterium]